MKKVIAIFILTIILGGILASTSSSFGKTVQIYAKYEEGGLLRWNNSNLFCRYVVYNENGIEHPVYCLNRLLEGATEEVFYNVNIDNLLTNALVWRTIINGYPYKTPEELGCQTITEAFMATKQAVYCVLYDRDPNTYSARDNEGGERTLNALKNIVATAKASTETKKSADITITANNANWEQDSKDKNYISKEFIVSAQETIKDYKIDLDGDLVEGIKITDTNNVERNNFSGTEKFKILLPIKNVNKDGNFAIEVTGDVATKPIYYGLAENPEFQDVAITGNIYETGKGQKTEYFFKNETKIIILKQDQETKEGLEGVKFQILNENKEIIYTDLSTDEEGKITISGLLPAKYYIQEISTLENFEVYDKLIEIDLKLNEEMKVIVNNLKNEIIPETEIIKTEIEVEQIKTETEIEQTKEEIKIELPKTGM